LFQCSRTLTGSRKPLSRRPRRRKASDLQFPAPSTHQRRSVKQCLNIVSEESADELRSTININGEPSTSPAPAKSKAADKPPDSNSDEDDSDDDKNPSRRVVPKTNNVLVAVLLVSTPRNPDNGSSSKLFKMDLPMSAKRFWENMSRGTYFLTQLSRYLRLPMNVGEYLCWKRESWKHFAKTHSVTIEKK
jgi:hypothetical protein